MCFSALLSSLQVSFSRRPFDTDTGALLITVTRGMNANWRWRRKDDSLGMANAKSFVMHVLGIFSDPHWVWFAGVEEYP